MAAFKRYGIQSLLVVGLLLSLLIASAIPWLVGAYGGDAAHAQAQPDGESEPMAVVDFARVERLRSELGLRSLDLAAMGLQEAQVEGVLTALKSWVIQNSESMTEVESANARSAAALREAWRGFHTGDAEAGAAQAITSLEREAAAAAAQRQRLIDSAAAAASAVMPSTARSLWQTTRGNAELDPPYRYAAMTGEQKARLKEVLGIANGGHMAARRDVLGQSALAMDLAQSRVSSLLPSVLRTEATVLPLPEEYREERRHR